MTMFVNISNTGSVFDETMHVLKFSALTSKVHVQYSECTCTCCSMHTLHMYSTVSVHMLQRAYTAHVQYSECTHAAACIHCTCTVQCMSVHAAACITHVVLYCVAMIVG